MQLFKAVVPTPIILGIITKPMKINESDIRAFVDSTLSEIKGWPKSRRFYEFWKPTYRRHGNIVIRQVEGSFKLPPELKRCLLTLGESNINKCIYLESPRQNSVLEETVIFGQLFDARYLACKPESESPENIYVLSDCSDKEFMVAESLVPLLAMVNSGLKSEIRKGLFSYTAI